MNWSVEKAGEVNNYSLVLQNPTNLILYDLTKNASDIEVYTDIIDICGRMTFNLINPAGVIKLEDNIMGAKIVFSAGLIRQVIFIGRVFSITQSTGDNWTVLCYDATRYLSNKFYGNLGGGINPSPSPTLMAAFTAVCLSCNLIPTMIQGSLAAELLDNKVALGESGRDILKSATEEVFNHFFKKYIIRASNMIANTLEIGELEKIKDLQMVTGNLYILGEQSLLTNYSLEYSIEDSADEVIVIAKKKVEENGMAFDTYSQAGQAVDTIKQARWGKLVYTHETEQEDLITNAQKTAMQILIAKNKVNHSIQLDTLGVNGLRAGDAFILQMGTFNFLQKEKNPVIMEKLWIQRCTHNYSGEIHTMSLQVGNLLAGDFTTSLLQEAAAVAS